MRQKITCPESAHLEEIEFDERPIDGKLIGVRTCSRFHPEGDVDCDMMCMHRINTRFKKESSQAEHDDGEHDSYEDDSRMPHNFD